MSVTKSYNKQTGIYYAYETTYEWDEEKQKKVQHKRCIGQFDPETGKVIPNGKVGRPSLDKQQTKHRKANPQVVNDAEQGVNSDVVEALIDRLTRLEEKANALSEEIHELLGELSTFSSTDK